MNIAMGAACEPRLNVQRNMGRDRDAGCERNMGMSKADCVAIPPDAKSAVDMLMIWTADIVAPMIQYKLIDLLRDMKIMLCSRLARIQTWGSNEHICIARDSGSVECESPRIQYMMSCRTLSYALS